MFGAGSVCLTGINRRLNELQLHMGGTKRFRYHLQPILPFHLFIRSFGCQILIVHNLVKKKHTHKACMYVVENAGIVYRDGLLSTP